MILYQQSLFSYFVISLQPRAFIAFKAHYWDVGFHFYRISPTAATLLFYIFTMNFARNSVTISGRFCWNFRWIIYHISSRCLLLALPEHYHVRRAGKLESHCRSQSISYSNIMTLEYLYFETLRRIRWKTCLSCTLLLTLWFLVTSCTNFHRRKSLLFYMEGETVTRYVRRMLDTCLINEHTHTPQHYHHHYHNKTIMPLHAQCISTH